MIFVNGIPTEYGLAEVKRMIDEKKLLEKIDNNVPDLTSDQIYKIAEVIVKQPKVNEWLPCSERLPEKAGKYLVTIIESGSVHTSVRRFNPKPKHQEQNEPIFTKHLPYYSGWERATKGVIAWMPLPAPSSVEE